MFKIAKDVQFFMFSGSEFHSLVATGMKDLLYKFVLDLGTVRSEELRKVPLANLMDTRRNKIFQIRRSHVFDHFGKRLSFYVYNVSFP